MCFQCSITIPFMYTSSSSPADMWLNLQFTYARNSSFAAIAKGAYDNIRLMSGDSQSQGLSPSFPPTHPWRRIQDAASLPSSSKESLDTFSAPCYHFAEALTDQFVAAGKPAPTVGLLNMAIGGSMIEEWITNEVVSETGHHTGDIRCSFSSYVAFLTVCAVTLFVARLCACRRKAATALLPMRMATI